MMEEWSINMLQLLDTHFSQHDYLLGTPSMADFALAGPFVAHLGRDPWPQKHLVAKFAHVQAWVTRMENTSHHDVPLSTMAHDDIIPASLNPILASICSEYVPMLEETVNAVKVWHSNDKFAHGASLLPRSTSDIQFPLGKHTFTRAGSPFFLWKIQLLLDAYRDMSMEDRSALTEWIAAQPFDAGRVLKLDFPRIEREALRVKFAS